MTEWRPSDPEPGKDYPGIPPRVAEITVNRPEVRSASRSRILLELPDAYSVARDDPRASVIILTALGNKVPGSVGHQKISGDDGYVLGFAQLSRRP